MIWQNPLYVEERASDLAELPVPVIWQSCLCVDSLPVIWQLPSCLSVEEVSLIWQRNCLSVDSVPMI